MKSNLSQISEIIKDLSEGKMVVIVDDEKRENEAWEFSFTAPVHEHKEWRIGLV